LSKGAYVVLKITKILTTGAATAGKTCTKHYIFDKPPPDQYTSTDVFVPEERHYAYHSAVVDPQDPCEWNIATLGNTLAMIKKSIISKEKNIKFDDEPRFDVQIDSPPTESIHTADTQVTVLEGVRTTPVHLKAKSTQKQNDTIQKLLDPALKISGEVLKLHWVHFVDGGGQSEFLELLPALVSNVTVTIYVIDLTTKPNDHCNDFFTIKDKPQGTRKTFLTGKELFERFLQTICSQKDEEKCKVMFVGTHYDGTPEIENNLKEWDLLIRTFWNEYEAEKVEIIKSTENCIVHEIEAKSPGDSKQIAVNMRKKLAQCCIKRRVAIAEFLIEEDLKSSSLAQEHYGILTYSECQGITRKYAKENTLKKALQYFHELNEYLCFPTEHLVFTKPRILIQMISKLIKVANHCRGEDVSGIPQDFRKSGLISDKDLRDVLDYDLPGENFKATKYYRPGVFEGEELLKVLKKLFIAAYCAELSAYFIPCVLPPCSKPESDDINKDTRTFMKENSPLLITFKKDKKGSIPRGLFCGLVTHLIDKYGWQIRSGNEQNYRTLIEFEIPRRYKLVLMEDFKLACIRVHAAEAACKPLRLEVRKNITDGIETVGKKFYGTEDDSIMCPNASFECSCSHSKENELSHIASVVSHETDAKKRRLVCEKSGEDVAFTAEHFDWLHKVEDPQSSGTCNKLCNSCTMVF
jgi:hypothetical protein